MTMGPMPMPIPGRDATPGRFIPTMNQPAGWENQGQRKKKQDWIPSKMPLLMRLLEAAKVRAEKLEEKGPPAEERLKALEALYREALAADREGREPKIQTAQLLSVLAFQTMTCPPAPPAPHRPAEHAFPKYLALVNTINCTAFAMRFASLEKAEATLDFRNAPPDPWTAIDLTTTSPVTDAQCMVRPYLRLHADAPKDAIEVAQGMKIDLEVDGERLITGGWAAEHLALPDGTGFRRTPFQFPKTAAAGCLFRAAGLDNAQQANPDDSHGFMLPNGSRIFLRVHGIHGTAMVLDGRLSAGLVLANYTTKP